MTADRDLLALTPADLVGLYAGRTTAAADALAVPLLGRRLRVEGTLDSVVEHVLPAATGRRYHIVALAEYAGDGAPVVVLWFESARWALRLALLGPGTPVVVVGTLAGVSHHTVQLRDCELE